MVRAKTRGACSDRLSGLRAYMEIFLHFVYYSSSTRQKVGQIQPLHCQLSGVSGEAFESVFQGFKHHNFKSSEAAAEASISKPEHMQ